MKAQASILVGKIEGSKVVKACEGKLYSVGATFPKVFGMTDSIHDEISRAARWLLNDRANWIDLDCGFRVSLFDLA